MYKHVGGNFDGVEQSEEKYSWSSFGSWGSLSSSQRSLSRLRPQLWHDIISGFTNWDGQYVSSDSHSGWLAVTIERSLAGKSGPDSIGLLGRYFHQVLPFEGSITIGAAQLSISLPSCYSWNTNPLYTFSFNWDDF